MKIRIIFISLIALAIAYKIINKNSVDVPSHRGEQVMASDQDPGDGVFGIRTNVEEEKSSTDDSSGEELTALQYMNKYVNHTCWPATFERAIKCKFKNRGDREISGVTVEIRASDYAGDGIDMRGGKYKPYEVEFDGPLLPHATTDLDAEFITDKDIKWVSERSRIVSSEY